MSADVIALTRALVRLDTVGGREDDALALIAPLLDDAGFTLSWVPWQDGRSNLIATWNGGGNLVLSGHVDTVPFGSAEWRTPPLSGELDGDRLLGRGASDMKGGVAAIVTAAVQAAARDAGGFTVALTSGEETGCEGARLVRDAGLLPPNAVLVLGESTGNELRLGHKGATWLRATARGRSAHGSRPELGVNAIDALVDAITAVRAVAPGPEHPYLGSRTRNVGTITGGVQTNLVPDLAALTLDVRTVPGADADDIVEALRPYVEIESTLDLAPVWSPEDAELTQLIREAVTAVTGVTAPPLGVSYFTDAAVLDASHARSYIVGPGDADQPHTTDESVSVRLVEQAVDVYGALIDRLAV